MKTLTKKTVKKTPAITYAGKNGYENLSPAEAGLMEAVNKLYLEFLGTGKTEREAHDEGVRLLKASGFRDLVKLEKEHIRLAPGDRVYKSCAGKTLMAVIIGKKPLEAGMHIVGAHTDAPRIARVAGVGSRRPVVVRLHINKGVTCGKGRGMH